MFGAATGPPIRLQRTPSKCTGSFVWAPRQERRQCQRRQRGAINGTVTFNSRRAFPDLRLLPGPTFAHLSPTAASSGTETDSALAPPALPLPTTSWVQKFIELPAMKRGCHVITRHILKGAPEIAEFSVGICHIFVMHTSCSLSINENASPDVALDMEDALNRIVPEGNHYRHLDEGYDDMPAHVKAALMGSSLTVPIAQNRLALGTWQGIWLNEHRDYGGPRRFVVTIQGLRCV